MHPHRSNTGPNTKTAISGAPIGLDVPILNVAHMLRVNEFKRTFYIKRRPHYTEPPAILLYSLSFANFILGSKFDQVNSFSVKLILTLCSWRMTPLLLWHWEKVLFQYHLPKYLMPMCSAFCLLSVLGLLLCVLLFWHEATCHNHHFCSNGCCHQLLVL